MRFAPPSSDEEWRQAESLITQLEDWDAAQSHALGFTREEIVEAFYSAGTRNVRVDSAPPEGRLLIAFDDVGEPIGVAAFHRLDARRCELYNVFVRPEARGRGVARRLLEQLIRDAVDAGYGSMRLETATFMREAHRVYHALGFVDVAPYRQLEPRYAAVTRWMERDLAIVPQGFPRRESDASSAS